MDEALAYCKKFPIRSVVDIREVYRICPIDSYQTKPSRDDIFVITYKQGFPTYAKCTKEDAAFNVFLLEHAQVSKDEYLIFLVEFLSKLGKDVTIEELKSFLDHPEHKCEFFEK